MAVEPTEQVEAAQVRYPYLRKRLAPAIADDDLDAVKHSDKITINVSPAGYGMTFINSEPFGTGGVQWFVGEGVENVAFGTVDGEAKKDKAREKLVRNTAWMAGLGTEEVEKMKVEFKRVAEWGAVDGGKDDEDVDMDEA
jgi:paired amphipathic helix protein Sin3a